MNCSLNKKLKLKIRYVFEDILFPLFFYIQIIMFLEKEVIVIAIVITVFQRKRNIVIVAFKCNFKIWK